MTVESDILTFEGEPFEVSPGDLAFLSRLLGRNLEVTVRGAMVRRVAGHAKLPSGQILRVRSRKSSARSLLTWLAFCDPSLESLRRISLAPQLGDQGELAALTASLFADELLRAAGAHGLARTYTQHARVTGVVRGRIDFAREARARGDRAAVACIVWERSAETSINRWLSTAARCIATDAVMREGCGASLAQVCSLLAGIPPLSRGELAHAPPRAPRHLIHLEHALSLASLIVRNSHLDAGQTEYGASFFINLESLFEETVVRAFHHAGLTCRPKHPVRFRRSDPIQTAEQAMHLDLFCPDVSGGLVIDAKYKTSPSAANLQQMVTYCYLTGAHRAVLVFPSGHLRHRTRYTLSDPRGAAIIVDTAELETNAATIGDWQRFGQRLVSDVLEVSTDAPPSHEYLGPVAARNP